MIPSDSVFLGFLGQCFKVGGGLLKKKMVQSFLNGHIENPVQHSETKCNGLFQTNGNPEPRI